MTTYITGTDTCHYTQLGHQARCKKLARKRKNKNLRQEASGEEGLELGGWGVETEYCNEINIQPGRTTRDGAHRAGKAVKRKRSKI